VKPVYPSEQYRSREALDDRRNLRQAKSEIYSADAGLEQAKSYAEMLDVPFAYSSNGASFVEFDFFSRDYYVGVHHPA
jgi:hypothetical protein